MDRSEFLDRVRLGLRGWPGGPALPSALPSAPPALPSVMPATFASGDGRGFERFAEELAAAGGKAVRVPAVSLTDEVAARSAGCATAVVSAGLGEHHGAVLDGLARAGCAVLGPDRDGAARADLGVTGAVLGVAATGSVLLAAGPGAPRTAGLLPSFHLVVLPEERIVPGFEELFAAVSELAARSSQLVLVTGPSRTSDIELMLVRGVHGPERVAVVVVER